MIGLKFKIRSKRVEVFFTLQKYVKIVFKKHFDKWIKIWKIEEFQNLFLLKLPGVNNKLERIDLDFDSLGSGVRLKFELKRIGKEIVCIRGLTRLPNRIKNSYEPRRIFNWDKPDILTLTKSAAVQFNSARLALHYFWTHLCNISFLDETRRIFPRWSKRRELLQKF